MAKINFNLRKAQTNVKDQYKVKTPLNLVLRWNNNRLVHPTNLTILPQHWESDRTKGKNFQRAKRTLVGYAEFNRNLNIIESTASTAFQKFVADHNRMPNVNEFKDSLNLTFHPKTNIKLDFVSFFKKFIKESESTKEKRHSTITIYKTALNHLLEFKKLKKYKIDFDTIDLDFYHEYFEYLSKEKKFGENNVGKQIKVIKTVLNDATERGLNQNMAFRSKRFKVVSNESENIYLNQSELKELYDLDLSKNKRLEKIRDLFYIGCWTGLRYSDFNQIKSENIRDNKLFISTTKIKGQKIAIPLTMEVLNIQKMYNGKFPSAPSNQKFNEYLKEVCALTKSLKEKISVEVHKEGLVSIIKKEKYKLVSAHTARRSFATNCYKLNVPVSVIMGVTGHKTESSFFKYIKITPSEKADILQMYLNQNNENLNLKVV